MATVGKPLTSPESGWRRIEITTDSNNFTISGVMGGWEESGTSGGHISSLSRGNSIKFKFTGTRLRLITKPFNNRFNNNTIIIDGVHYTFSDYTTTSIQQCLTFEKLDLENGEHTCIIKAGDTPSSATSLTLDAIDIDENGAIMAAPFSVGDKLQQPEIGWKRYDDTDPAIKYEGSWDTYTENLFAYYGGSLKASNTLGSKFSFTFKGTKIRLIDSKVLNRSQQVKITIDGVIENYSEKGTVATNENNVQILVFEKTNLNDEIHNITIEATDTDYVGIDAIDIDSNGRLFHPDEVTYIKDLDVGKRIRCHYQANSGQVGVFSGLGQETSDSIPVESTATPNGDFYFLMVEDWNGQKKLIADRNIQHSVSWDSLNNTGVVNGNTLPKIVFGEDGGANKQIKSLGLTLKDSNVTTGGYVATRVNMGVTKGKWYYEAVATSYDTRQSGARTFIGIMDRESVISNSQNGDNVNQFLASVNKCHLLINNTLNNIVGVAVNLDDNKISFYVNGVLSEEKNIEAGVEWYPFYASKWGTEATYNFGASPFRYAPPKEFSPYEESLTENPQILMRLLSGGISSSDNDNEWDKYIANSNLNDTITAGDNNVWNWNGGVNIWTTTSSPTNSAQRVIRGRSSLTYWGAGTSSSIANVGFRPVIVITFPLQYKSFIKLKNEYKKYNSDWQTISTTSPSKDTFIKEGMPDLSILDRHPTTFTIPIDDNTPSGQSLGNGKLFKEKINLKKFIEINSINVK
ncbi:hypothetical protein ACE3MQ_09200 [Paenibacillus lentus]|uniref:hypothetical protein n=1 Tax=Paenibacillus lentus TaxID=1338368 RepID=UPI00365C3124